MAAMVLSQLLRCLEYCAHSVIVTKSIPEDGKSKYAHYIVGNLLCNT